MMQISSDLFLEAFVVFRAGMSRVAIDKWFNSQPWTIVRQEQRFHVILTESDRRQPVQHEITAHIQDVTIEMLQCTRRFRSATIIDRTTIGVHR